MDSNVSVNGKRNNKTLDRYIKELILFYKNYFETWVANRINKHPEMWIMREDNRSLTIKSYYQESERKKMAKKYSAAFKKIIDGLNADSINDLISIIPNRKVYPKHQSTFTIETYESLCTHSNPIRCTCCSSRPSNSYQEFNEELNIINKFIRPPLLVNLPRNQKHVPRSCYYDSQMKTLEGDLVLFLLLTAVHIVIINQIQQYSRHMYTDIAKHIDLFIKIMKPLEKNITVIPKGKKLLNKCYRRFRKKLCKDIKFKIIHKEDSVRNVLNIRVAKVNTSENWQFTDYEEGNETITPLSAKSKINTMKKEKETDTPFDSDFLENILPDKQFCLENFSKLSELLKTRETFLTNNRSRGPTSKKTTKHYIIICTVDQYSQYFFDNKNTDNENDINSLIQFVQCVSERFRGYEIANNERDINPIKRLAEELKGDKLAFVPELGKDTRELITNKHFERFIGELEKQEEEYLDNLPDEYYNGEVVPIVVEKQERFVKAIKQHLSSCQAIFFGNQAI